MKKRISKKIISLGFVILLALSMLPVMMTTAYATINGTVTFNATDSTNVGQVLHDGSTGSSDIAGIQMDVFIPSSPENAVAGTGYGSWVYFDTSSIGGANPAVAPIDADSGKEVVGAEPPRYFAIKSNDGSNFSFQSIYLVDNTGSQPEVTFDGYRDGNYIGTVTLNINRDTYYETFQLGNGDNNLTQSIFQNVDMVLVSNPDTTTWTGGIGTAPPHGNMVYINNIKIGDPVLPPTVTAVSPSNGAIAGGTSVTITGTNFIGVTGVKFGSNNATNITVNSTTSITADAPAGSGNVDIIVTADGGSGTGTGMYTYGLAQASITYNDITKVYGDADFIYTASGGSGTGALSYTSSDPTVATINSTTGSVSILKAGTTTLTATKAASGEYGVANKSCTLIVTKAAQGTITYSDITKTFGDAPFTYTASGGSGTGAFSYTSSDTSVATINSTTGSVTILKAGTATLTATKAADTNYNAASNTCTLTVNKGNQAAITYNDVTKACGDANFIYTASGGSGTGAFSYSSSDPTVATIDASTGNVNILEVGTTTLTATKAADTNYNAASDTCTLTVNKGNQSAITYNDVTKVYGDADFVYAASGGSGTGTFSYTSSDPTVATINSTTGSVSILKVGATTLTATKAGDTNYNSASKGCTLTVNKGNQAAITYNDVTKAYGDADFVYTASGGSGTGTFSYTSSDPTVATINLTTGSVSILKAGTTTLIATKAGDANYNSANKGCTLTVNKGNQSAITYNDVSKVYGDAPFTYTASGGSGIGVFSYTSSDPTVATINSTTGSVSILKAGTTTLTATKAGDTNYNSASKGCTLTVNKENQSAITYNNVTKVYGDTDFVYTASNGSGTGAFSYTSSDPTVATINSTTGSVSILKAGTVTLTATKAGDSNYNSASKDCILTVNKGNQSSITYNDVTKTYGDADFVYTATGGSGTGAFSYSSSDPTVATINSTTGSVSILKTGTTTLTATKAGDTNYNSANDTCTLTVNKGNQAAVTYNDVTKAYGDVDFVYTAGGGSGTGAFSYTSSDPTVATINSTTGSVSILKAGTTTLTATKAGDTNYNAEGATCTLTVNKAVQSISITTIPVKTTYFYGESLDVSGGEVTITFTDSSTSTAALTSGMCSAAATPEIGTRTVTVTYLGHTSTFDVTYSKAAQITPTAPVLSVTGSGITVTAPVGAAYEYSKDGGISWQPSVNFTGLTHATSYTITVRLKETATKNASNASAGSTATFMDITAPSLTAGTVSRASDTTATVKFTSNEAGEYYYSIVADGDPAPSIDTSGAGINCTTAETTITNPTGLAAGAKDIYIKVKDSAGNVSNALKIDIAAYVVPSSGSSGGGTIPSGTGVEILVNGKTETAATATTTQKDDKTVTTVTVDDKKVEEKLQAEGNNATVTIPVNNNSDVVVGQLNGQTVKNMETKEAVLEIKTENVTYTLPASQINIDNVSDQIGQQVELKDIKVNVTISAPPADTAKVVEDTANKNNYQVVVKPVEFNITCSSGNKTVEVSKFNGYVDRMVAIPDGIDPSKITTGIVLNSDGTFSHVPTVITKINGKYYAKINSLTNSTYSVIWSPKTFKDVENHWAKDAVNDMASRLVISGVGNDSFAPDKDITRAEFSAIIVRALGLMHPGTGKASFSDVSKNDWYYDAVSIAYEYGIISGYGNGKFGPNDKISHEQAMAMIARAMKITKLKADFKSGEEEQLIASYGDFKKASSWAKNSIALCVKTGVVPDGSGKLAAPKDNITRAEVAVIVQRLLKKSRLI